MDGQPRPFRPLFTAARAVRRAATGGLALAERGTVVDVRAAPGVSVVRAPARRAPVPRLHAVAQTTLGVALRVRARRGRRGGPLRAPVRALGGRPPGADRGHGEG